MEITFFPDLRLNPVRWTQSPTLYCIAIKAGLAVQVCYIPIPSDTILEIIKVSVRTMSLFDGSRTLPNLFKNLSRFQYFCKVIRLLTSRVLGPVW